jgi:CubicO group peptidase (beta-lactamase class C family)
MKDTTYSAAAIATAANHAEGYRYTSEESVEVPLQQPFPYAVDGAGDINSNIEDMAKWVSLQLAGGTTPDGQRIVSAENLAYTRTPKVAVNDKESYALGWIVQQTPNGTVVWHNGGTHSCGSMVILQLDRKLGVIILSNESNVGMPGAVDLWTIDHLLGNPVVDYGAETLTAAKAIFADGVKQFARPANPQPSPPLSPLAGNFANPGFGKAIFAHRWRCDDTRIRRNRRQAAYRPVEWCRLQRNTGAHAKFAAIAANLGPLPIAFAQFQSDKKRQAHRPSSHVLGRASL